MSGPAQTFCGSVFALWRYPVKSMMGEELNAAEVSKAGLLGDRTYALVDSSEGKVASAKNPRKWPMLFGFRAALADVPRTAMTLPPVGISLPDGTIVSSEQRDIHRILSTVLKRPVTLEAAERVRQAGAASSVPDARAATAEEYWPDMEGLEYRDTVTDFGLPRGTFFDAAVVHVLTTATLDRLRTLYPQGRFAVRRFRPNMVIETADGGTDFVENAWIGRTLAIGDGAPEHQRPVSPLRDDNACSG
jgi:uncharacterized protein